MRRVLRALASLLAWSALSVLALAASAVICTRLPVGRRVAATFVSDFASRELRGGLAIARFTRLEPSAITARGVVLFDGDGREVVSAERLVLRLDLDALLHGRIRIARALIDRASVQLIDDKDGLPTLISCFDSGIPSPPGKASGPPLEIRIDGLTLSNVDVRGDLLGLRNLHAVGLAAKGGIRIGRDVRVAIESAHAVVTEPFGFVGYVDSLAGRVSTAPREGVNLHAAVHRAGERVEGDIRYLVRSDPAHPELELDLDAHALSTSTLHGLGYGFIPDTPLPLSGKLALRGPIEQLELHAAVTTEAGALEVAAAIASARGASVHVQTESLELERLFPDYPRLRVRGNLRIEAPNTGEAPALELEVDPTLYGVIAVPGFKLAGALTDTGLRIDSIDARSPGGHISGSGRIERAGALSLNLKARYADIASDANLSRAWPGAHAALDAALKVASPRLGQSQFSFDGRIALGRLRAGVLTAQRLELSGHAYGDPAGPRLRASLTGKDVRIGKSALGDPLLRVTGGPRSYTAEGQISSEGRRTFDLSAKITAEAEGFRVDADSVELSIGRDTWRGAIQGLRVTPGRGVELALLRLAERSQRLEAHGVLRFHGEDELDAELQDFDLAALRAVLGASFALSAGHADAHVQLRGDIDTPELKVQGALRGGVLGSLRDLDALYLVRYEAGQIELDGELGVAGHGALEVSGTGRVDRNLPNPLEALRLGSYEIELRSENLELGLLPGFAAARIEGTTSGSVYFQGTLQNPGFTGSAQIDDLRRAGSAPLYVFVEAGYHDDELSARFSLSDEQGLLGNANAEVQLAWAELSTDPSSIGARVMRGPWHIAGDTSARRLDHLPAPLAHALPYPFALATHFDLQKSAASTHGTLHFDAVAEEPLFASDCAPEVRPKIAGDVTLEHGVSRLVAFVVSGEDHLGRVDAELETPVDRWQDEGHFERPSMLRARGELTVAAIQRFPYLCEYGSGEFRAGIELDAGLSPEPLLAATIDTTFAPRAPSEAGRRHLTVQSCGDDPVRGHMQLSADRDALTGSGRMQGCHGGAIDVSGQLPVRWDKLFVLPSLRGGAPLKAQLRFSGAQLRPLLDRIPGVINGDAIAFGQVSVAGTLEQTRMAGQLDVNDGRLYLISMGQDMSAISARLSFQGDWAKLEHFQARLGSGRIEAEGGLGFTSLFPQRAKLALLCKDLPVKREGVDIAWLTGSAAVDADIGEARSHAAVQLQSLDVRLPDTSTRTLQPLERNPEVVVVTEKPKTPGVPYPIELMITGKKKLTVHRNDFSAVIAAELAVSYRDPDLNVGGYITFGSGDFEIFGKRFGINNGALRFDGGPELDPDVFLVATQKPDTAGVSPVTVSVTGTLSEPVVTFTSDVCPGDSGAITYLVSGQCATDDPDLAQQSAETQAAFTSGIVGGVLTLGAQRELSALSPRFSVQRTGIGAQRVSAGISSEKLIPKFMRKLVRRVYVEGGVYTPGSDQSAAAAETGTTTGSALQFLIELYFPHNIVGSGRFAQENWGVDMLWEP